MWKAAFSSIILVIVLGYTSALAQQHPDLPTDGEGNTTGPGMTCREANEEDYLECLALYSDGTSPMGLYLCEFLRYLDCL
jgi:hypothetical protein